MCETRTSVKMPVPVSRSVTFFTLSKPFKLARCGFEPSWQVMQRFSSVGRMRFSKPTRSAPSCTQVTIGVSSSLGSITAIEPCSAASRRDALPLPL